MNCFRDYVCVHFVFLLRSLCVRLVILSLVYCIFCLLVFACRYQCNRLPGKADLRNDLLCVTWDVKSYTLTHPSNVIDENFYNQDS